MSENWSNPDEKLHDEYVGRSDFIPLALGCLHLLSSDPQDHFSPNRTSPAGALLLSLFSFHARLPKQVPGGYKLSFSWVLHDQRYLAEKGTMDDIISSKNIHLLVLRGPF